MIYLDMHKHTEPDYDLPYEFAKQMYLLPRMNLEIYYRPTVLFSASRNNEIIGTIGMNVGFVANEMLSRDQRICTLINSNACDQSIFALNTDIISVAPCALAALIAVYGKISGSKYLGILAIPVSRKIMARIGIVTLKNSDGQSFGKPDKNLLPPEHRHAYDTWFSYNEPISIEIVDLCQAFHPCMDYLMNLYEKNRIFFSQRLWQVLS